MLLAWCRWHSLGALALAGGVWCAGVLLCVVERLSGWRGIFYVLGKAPEPLVATDQQEPKNRLGMVPWYSLALFDKLIPFSAFCTSCLGHIDMRQWQLQLPQSQPQPLFDFLKDDTQTWFDWCADTGVCMLRVNMR